MSGSDLVLNFIAMVICFIIIIAGWIVVYDMLPSVLKAIMIGVTVAVIVIIIKLKNEDQLD
jgi:hypothetical protein